MRLMKLSQIKNAKYLGLFDDNLIILDSIDNVIIENISKNPQITQKELAEMLEMSQPSINSRMVKMINLGLIKYGYTISPEMMKNFIRNITWLKEDRNEKNN